MTTYRGSECMVIGCENDASWDIRLLPICYDHGFQIAHLYRGEILFLEQRQRETDAEERVERRATKRGDRTGAVVYYARIGDYIKIGFSTRLRSRLSTLRVDALLAVEPGGPELERERHQQFRVERIDLRRENFRPSDALLAHIEQTKAEHGLPHWASLPRTSEITIRHKEDA